MIDPFSERDTCTYDTQDESHNNQHHRDIYR